jgi:hypothetical protein
MTSETATRTQAPGNTCRWILRDMDEGLALLEITAQTKAGPVTGRYWVERVHQGTRWTCSCNDFRYRHADNPRSPGCKHARSLRAALTRLYV